VKVYAARSQVYGIELVKRELFPSTHPCVGERICVVTTVSIANSYIVFCVLGDCPLFLRRLLPHGLVRSLSFKTLEDDNENVLIAQNQLCVYGHHSPRQACMECATSQCLLADKIYMCTFSFILYKIGGQCNGVCAPNLT